MSSREDRTSSLLNTLSDIRNQFVQQKQQAICLTEQMIQHCSIAYIPQIFSCFPVGKYQLSQLDADMRRLEIICEIVAAEDKLSGEKPVFFENVESFEDLIQKYIRFTLLLRRLEFHLPQAVVEETAEVLAKGQMSICAARKITYCEIFTDPEYVYSQALQMMGEISVG